MVTPVRYWLKARKELLGAINVNGSYGLDEPPREVAIHLVTQIRLTPAWRLVSNTQVLPNWFRNPCQL